MVSDGERRWILCREGITKFSPQMCEDRSCVCEPSRKKLAQRRTHGRQLLSPPKHWFVIRAKGDVLCGWLALLPASPKRSGICRLALVWSALAEFIRSTYYIKQSDCYDGKSLVTLHMDASFRQRRMISSTSAGFSPCVQALEVRGSKRIWLFQCLCNLVWLYMLQGNPRQNLTRPYDFSHKMT